MNATDAELEAQIVAACLRYIVLMMALQSVRAP